MLASNSPRQVAAERALAKGKLDAEVYWELALGALARRDYARAYELFALAVQGGAHGSRVSALTVYSRFMASDQAGMEQILADLASGGTGQSVEPWFVQFLSQAATDR
jgi:hypothetical protein